MHKTTLLFITTLLVLAGWPVLAADTTGPQIASVVVAPAVVALSDTVHVTAIASDDVGVAGVTADSLELENTSGSTWEGDIAANAAIGTHGVTVIARDAAGNTKSDTSGSYRTAQVIGLRNDQAFYSTVGAVTGQYLFKVWGKATYRDENTFTLNDGGPLTTWVTCPGHGVCSDDYVAARGILDPSIPPARLTNVQYQIYQQAPREQMTIGDITVGKDLQDACYGTLPYSVPLGTTLSVTIMSSDPSKVRLSKTTAGAGTASIVVSVAPGSQTIPIFYVYGLDSTGVVDVVATAPDCLGRTFKVTLAPSGFTFWSPAYDFGTTAFSANTTLAIRPARLEPTYLYPQYWQRLRGGITVDVPVTSSDPAVGTITTSPIVFANGAESGDTLFDPIAAGASTLSVGVPAGFSTPSNYRQITATVTAPDVVGYAWTPVGVDLQADALAYLEAAPPSPVDITVTVADPSKATLTIEPLVEGTASITFTGVGGTGLNRFYVQGRSVGSTTMSISAPGYNTKSYAVTVNPSGFVINNCSDFNTTSFSENTPVDIRPACLSADTLAYWGYQPIRGGRTVDVTVTSSDPAAGVITPATIHFASNSLSGDTAFDPIGPGTAIVSVVPPAGFSTPCDLRQMTATVTAPGVISGDETVGVDLQTEHSVHLEAAPPSPVDVTVTVADESIATLSTSTSATTEGSASITITGVSSAGSQWFYVQGRSQGTTTMTCSAPGYSPRTYTITVDPSGFYIIWPGSDYRTTVYSANTAVSIASARLNPTTLVPALVQRVRGGKTVNVTVTSSDPAVVAITTSPIIFSPNDNWVNALFDPLTVGESTVTVETPAGFTTPSQYTQTVISVELPIINAQDATVGRDLQAWSYVSLETSPPSPVTITVTVSDPAKATITTDPAVAGSGSITFTNADAGVFYVQGRGIGMTSIVSSAPGFATSTRTVTIDPSGFVILSPASFSTTVAAADTSMWIYAARLNLSDLSYSTSQPVRGGLSVDVYVVSSNPSVGVITVSPVTFGPNADYISTAFDPLAVGTTDPSVVPPAGFSTPTTYRLITVTVSP